jgi:hypothetical protein
LGIKSRDDSASRDGDHEPLPHGGGNEQRAFHGLGPEHTPEGIRSQDGAVVERDDDSIKNIRIKIVSIRNDSIKTT